MGSPMKLACLVLACMIVAGPITSNAALTCGGVTSYVIPCLGYLTSGGPATEQCCNGVKGLNNVARSTPDRQQACRCLQGAAKNLGPNLNPSRAASLPGACGVKIPYPISASTNCNNVK